jgi:hypothetical protein
MTFSREISLVIAIALVLLSTTALGQALTGNWNPTGEGCVDTTGFLSCYNDQSSTATSCLDSCDNHNQKETRAYTNCVLSCNQAWLAANVGCWIQGCWNQACSCHIWSSATNKYKVYSCEYQLTATSYFGGTELILGSQVPFYPPPDDASAGACCWFHICGRLEI